MQDKEQWRRLCEQAAVEQDPARLMELIHEITGNRAPRARSRMSPLAAISAIVDEIHPVHPTPGFGGIRLFRSYNFPILPEHARPKALVAIASNR